MKFLERAMKNKSGETKLGGAERSALVEGITQNASLLGEARVYDMMRDRLEMPVLKVGSGTSEYTSMFLTATKLCLPWSITDEFLEGSGRPKSVLFDMIAKRMSTQAANDIEDLAINGDEESTDALLRAQDGWLKKATQKRIITWKRTEVNEQDVRKALKSINPLYRHGLRAYTSHDLEMDIMVERAGEYRLNFAGPAGVDILGVPVKAVTHMPKTSVLLANPDLLVLGVRDEVSCSARKAEAPFEQGGLPLGETRFLLTMRLGFAVQNTDAVVHVYVVPVKVALAEWARATKTRFVSWVRRVTRRSKA